MTLVKSFWGFDIVQFKKVTFLLFRALSVLILHPTIKYYLLSGTIYNH
jgi:hypothetical protein